MSGNYQPITGDFDGDGNEDIFWYVPGTGSESIWFWFNTGSGDYTSRAFTVAGGFRPVAGDFDGDGFDDVFWYSPGTGSDSIWWGNANVDTSAAFTTTVDTQGGNFQPMAGDFDHNGVDDIVWYQPGSGADSVHYGTGNRSNPWLGRSISIGGTFDLHVADFDGDRRDDLLFYSSAGADTIWWGTDVNSFGPTGQHYVTLGAGLDPAAGDFDGDGRGDLLVYSSTAADTVWWGSSTRTAFSTAAHRGLAPDPATTTYTYDARGLRQSVGGASGGTRTATWSHNGTLGLLLTETSGAGTTRYVYGVGPTPIAQYDPDGTVHLLHSDMVGSVRTTTTSTGALSSTTTWDAYGNEVGHTRGRPTRFGFGGGYTDPETGLVYLRARYYDPETAQLLTRDPLELATGSAYGYVGNSPLNGTDPTGMAPWDDLCLNNPFDPDDGCDSISEQHPEESQATADFAGGVLDVVSMGQWRRSSFLTDRVDECSAAFGAGLVAGTVVDLALGVRGGGSSRALGAVDDLPSRGTSSRFIVGSDGVVVDTVGSRNAISIGHFPGYVDDAAASGSRVFSIGDDAWDAMSAKEQWLRNQRFLDDAIARGSEIRLATPLAEMRPGSGYAREIQYLASRGYTPSADGTRMVPG